MSSDAIKNQCLLKSIFLNQTSMGIYLILIGAILPQIRTEYDLSYRFSGIMIGTQSFGAFIAGVIAPLLPTRFGTKKIYSTLTSIVLVGLGIIVATGNPKLLLCSMIIIGISKGSCGIYNNTLVSNLSNNNTSMLNLLQAHFAIGACIAPIIVTVCGTDWKKSIMVEILFGLFVSLYTICMKIEPEGPMVLDQENVIAFGFFKKRVFWICTIYLSFYMTMETCIMGFIISYYVDTGIADKSLAQLIAIFLWGAFLIGRFICVVVSKVIKPVYMLFFMTIGVAFNFGLFIFGQTTILVTMGSIGLGLFLAGMYGTAVGNVGDLLKRYPFSMGIMIIIPGIISSLIPGIIGSIAYIWDIHKGMMFLFLPIAVLVVVSTMDFFRIILKKT